jgi:hypothetical protein
MKTLLLALMLISPAKARGHMKEQFVVSERRLSEKASSMGVAPKLSEVNALQEKLTRCDCKSFLSTSKLGMLTP